MTPIINSDLFNMYYKNVIHNPDAPYISFHKTNWTYREVNSIVYRTIELIQQHTDGQHLCLALSFKDPLKLIISFWACTALSADIILIPDHIPYLAVSGKETITPVADLILSDFVQHEKTYDIDLYSCTPHLNYITINTAPTQAHIFFFTSGTTGDSKFITTTYYQFTRAIAALREHNVMPYNFSQHVLLTVPIFHSYGLSAMIEYTEAGSHIILPNAPDSISPLQALMDKELALQITAIEGVPYFYKQLTVIISRLQLTNIKHMGMGGDSITTDILQKITAYKKDLTFSVRYGITEVPSVISLNYFKYNDTLDLKHLGNPLPIYSLELIDEKGIINATKGELRVSCLLYPEHLTSIYTNDLLEFQHGKFKFESRKLFIKNRGYKINPVEIEQRLNSYDGIMDSKVFSMNENLIAEIKTYEKELDLLALKHYLSAEISLHMIPDKFIIVDSIERNKIGKLKR